MRAEARIAEIKKRIDGFQVLESYRELADEVARLKSRMTEITAELALANETINYLSNAIKDEKPPAYAAIETLYSEAGIQLPGVAVRRFGEVQDFQNSVVANRKHYLEGEIEKARSAQSDLVAELRERDDRKSELLKTLDGKGAFEDLMTMHAQYAEISSRADQLRTKLQNATILESQLTKTSATAPISNSSSKRTTRTRRRRSTTPRPKLTAQSPNSTTTARGTWWLPRQSQGRRLISRSKETATAAASTR